MSDQSKRYAENIKHDLKRIERQVDENKRLAEQYVKDKDLVRKISQAGQTVKEAVEHIEKKSG